MLSENANPVKSAVFGYILMLLGMVTTFHVKDHNSWLIIMTIPLFELGVYIYIEAFLKYRGLTSLYDRLSFFTRRLYNKRTSFDATFMLAGGGVGIALILEYLIYSVRVGDFAEKVVGLLPAAITLGAVVIVYHTKGTIRFFLLALLVMGTIILYLDFTRFDLFNPYGDPEIKSAAFDNILVEAHGLLFDIVLFGIALAIYDSYRNKKEQMVKLKGYKGWFEPEAAHRVAAIIGNIDDSDSDYEHPHTDYSKLNLRNIKKEVIEARIREFENSLVSISMSQIDILKWVAGGLISIDLSESIMPHNLIGAYLKNANLAGADLQGVNFKNANLQRANLSGANLKAANLHKADLLGAKVSEAYWIEKLTEWEVLGRKDIASRYYVSKEKEDLYYIIKELYPKN